MIVVKYFHEEPAAVEILAADESADARQSAEHRSLEDFLAAPRYYRGYLAATDLGSGATGATAVPAAWLKPIQDALPAGSWWLKDGRWIGADGGGALAHAAAGTVLAIATGEPPVADAIELGGADVRRSLSAIRALLDAAAVVLVAEPAPDGVDWALFSPVPLADRVRDAFGRASDAGVRRFVIPFREARGEHRFYFERYDLSLYARYEIR